jgi:SAM-dependent methyltransferase
MLEIGCGAAGLAPAMAELGVDYFGIDIDPRPVESAQARGILNLRVADFIEEQPQRKYDVIFLTQVLEHIVHPRRMIERIEEALAEDGILHIDVPSQGTMAGAPSRLVRGLGARFGAIDWPHHSIAYTPDALRILLENRFRVRTFTATSDDPVWGQATTPNRVQKAYFTAQRVLGGKSLAVAFGQRNA